jgi:hypothetical protein
VEASYSKSQDVVLVESYFEAARKVSRHYYVLPNVTGIVVGGSLSRGLIDEYADLEIYVYYKGNLPSKQSIRDILGKLDAQLTRSHNPHWFHPAWGYHTFFQMDGIKIELGYRNLDQIISRMKRFLFGKLVLPKHGIHDVPFGHYESGVASCITECVILYDPNEEIKRLKELVQTYPKDLKQRTLRYYLDDARTITENKIRFAVLRDDTYHFNACVARVVRAVVLCLFALNDTYFPGDKWNQHYISRFSLKPENYEALINELFTTPDLLQADKRRKIAILRELISWIENQVDDPDQSAEKPEA